MLSEPLLGTADDVAVLTATGTWMPGGLDTLGKLVVTPVAVFTAALGFVSVATVTTS